MLIADFLTPFRREGEAVSLRTFPPKGGKGEALKIDASLPELGDLSPLQDRLRDLNKKLGVYFVVNPGGQDDASITRYTAAFVENDDRSIADQHEALNASPLPTSIRVETRKSVHAYWLIESDCSESEWRAIQAGLISRFDGDPKIKNPSRCMRLPGFNHVALDDDGQLQFKPVECVLFEPDRRYSAKELMAAFPQPESETPTIAATNGHYESWDALNLELRRRILNHPSTTVRGGWAHTKGVCHNGKGATALALNLLTGAYACQSNCSTAGILQAFGLPDRPGTPSELPEANRVICMASVEPQSVSWLWKHRIPLGKVTLIEGDPGVGKSYLTDAIAAAAVAGNGLPGEEASEPRNVLLLTAEDGLADTVRPRLDKMKADVSRIFALEDLPAFDVPGLLRLEAAIIEKQAALVVIDPLIAYMSKTDIHRANAVRAVMAALARIAERQGCAIVCVRHLTKSHKDRAIYAGAGSIDFTAACRSVLLVGADPEDPTKRAIVQTKNNLSEFASAVGYTINGDGFFWTGESDLTAERILADASGEDARNENRDAEDFLRQALSEGPRAPKDVQREATQHGITTWALRRARGALGIKATKQGGHFGKDQGWSWALSAELVSQDAELVSTHATSQVQSSYANKKTSDNGLAELESPGVWSQVQGDLSQVHWPLEREGDYDMNGDEYPEGEL